MSYSRGLRRSPKPRQPGSDAKAIALDSQKPNSLGQSTVPANISDICALTSMIPKTVFSRGKLLMMRVATFISLWLALVIAWPLDAAAEPPMKQPAVPVLNQNGAKMTPAPTVPGITPGREKSRIHERAVTRDDYKPMAGSTPGVQVHRVTQPQASSGGASAESPAPTYGKPPSSLREKDRTPTTKKPVVK